MKCLASIRGQWYRPITGQWSLEQTLLTVGMLMLVTMPKYCKHTVRLTLKDLSDITVVIFELTVLIVQWL